MYVVPTKHYKDLPCCHGETAMFHNKGLKKVRAEYYKKWYNINKEEYLKIWEEKK